MGIPGIRPRSTAELRWRPHNARTGSSTRSNQLPKFTKGPTSRRHQHDGGGSRCFGVFSRMIFPARALKRWLALLPDFTLSSLRIRRTTAQTVESKVKCQSAWSGKPEHWHAEWSPVDSLSGPPLWPSVARSPHQIERGSPCNPQRA